MSSEASKEAVAVLFRRRMRLTDRDRQLMGILSWVRYLTEEQIGQLTYASRNRINLRKRINLLAGLGEKGFQPPYLRRLQYRTYEGALIPVWTLSEMGYRVAKAVLGQAVKVPRGDLGVEFLQHEVTLNRLFVELLKPVGRSYARAKLGGWRWTPSESARRPWTEYDVVAGKSRDRLIQPDAILEISQVRRRLFLECEMGGNSIQASSDEKSGAILAKAERYEEYFLGRPKGAGAKETFYTRDYPDGLTPELLFLVHSQRRQQNIDEAIQRWRRNRPVPGLQMRALTHEIAAAELRACLPCSGSSTPKPRALHALDRVEVLLLRDFFSTTVATLRDLRAKARSAGKTPPSYPPQAEKVKVLLEKFLTPSMVGRPS